MLPGIAAILHAAAITATTAATAACLLHALCCCRHVAVPSSSVVVIGAMVHNDWCADVSRWRERRLAELACVEWTAQVVVVVMEKRDTCRRVSYMSKCVTHVLHEKVTTCKHQHTHRRSCAQSRLLTCHKVQGLMRRQPPPRAAVPLRGEWITTTITITTTNGIIWQHCRQLQHLQHNLQHWIIHLCAAEWQRQGAVSHWGLPAATTVTRRAAAWANQQLDADELLLLLSCRLPTRLLLLLLVC